MEGINDIGLASPDVAAEQIVEGLREMVSCGWIHIDAGPWGPISTIKPVDSELPSKPSVLR
jgi:hypothetical protein